MRSILFLVGLILSTAVAQAQTFSSGSTGADGPLNVTANTVVQLPPSGVLNFTTVNVSPDTTLNFTPNGRNTPVTILAQGNVTIDGTISVDASLQAPGPGGFVFV